MSIWDDIIILYMYNNIKYSIHYCVFIAPVYLSVDDYEVQIKAEYVRNVCTYAC